MTERPGLRHLWTVVRDSAEQRLGTPLLLLYLALTVLGLVTVAASVIAMRL
jgi:hypothetical protein